ncbi:MAG: dienelactone hydrolase family protein [Thiolinea sp.]
MLIHEWGLNDQIKAVASELAKMGYIVFAADLYGGESTDADGAKALMSAVDAEQATATLTGWIDFLKNHERSTGKVATLGWCFGAVGRRMPRWHPVDATVIYYGRVTTPAAELEQLQGPVMGHFGKQDQNINEEMVAGFEKEMEAAGKSDDLTVYWYDADHAFANPTGSRYDEANAALSWERTSAFLQEQLQEG